MSHIHRRRFLVQSAGALAAASIVPDLSEGAEWARPPRAADPVRVAVIGTGRQGLDILTELQKLSAATVAAICDVDTARRNAGQRRAPGAAVYEDHRALLDKEPGVTAVFVATPTHRHREIVEHALQSGRHVYCEAPLAASLDDARAIVAAARGSRSIFQPSLLARSNPIYKLARTFLRSDSVRTLVGVRAQQHQKTSWRTPASDPARDKALNWRLDPDVSLGLPGEWGTHQFDVAHWYLGRYPATVRGAGSVRLHQDGRAVADTVDATLRFDDGVALQYQATLANSFEGRHEAFYGENAAIKLAWTAAWMFKEADAPTQGWEVYANRQQFHNDEGITLIADATKLQAQGKLKEGVGLPNPPLYYAIADFLKSVAEGLPVVCSAEEGLRATVVGILTDRAVRTGAEVAIDPGLLQ